jgi:DNA polymerase III sliding clamp (beta) subunit (PCNA family)
MAAVRRVSLVAERASPVRLTFGDGQVMIEAHTDGRARAVESVQAAFTGAEPVISFNPHYLLDGLVATAICGTPARHPASAGAGDAAAAESEPGRIRLEFTSPAKPALITWAGYEGALTADADTAEAAEAAEAADQVGAVEAADAVKAADAAEVADAEGTPASDDAFDYETPTFRYLVVPLRTPAGSSSARS